MTWTSRVYIDGQLVSGFVPEPPPADPWARFVRTIIPQPPAPPKKRRRQRATKYGIESIAPGASAIVPLSDEPSLGRLKTRIAAIIGMRARTFPGERYAYKVVDTGVEVRRIK